jgi:hypothetical protein
MELFAQREAVSGKYVPTKKINKLSNFYMDIVMAKKSLRREAKALDTIHTQFQSAGTHVPRDILLRQVVNATEFQELSQRH